VRVAHTDERGWVAYAAEPLPANKYIGEYAGDYVTSAEAGDRLARYDRDGTGHALLVVREQLPDGTVARTNIDATMRGNVSRFFSHRCGEPGSDDGPNLELSTVRSLASPLSRVGVFTARNVEVGEELSFSYGPPPDGRLGQRQRCLCGAQGCSGWLPYALGS